MPRRGAKRPRASRRNPLVPLVRGLGARVQRSGKAYTRKAKHKRREQPAPDERS